MNDQKRAIAPALKALRRLTTIRSSNVDKVMEEGEEIVSLCNYVDVYYNDRITADIAFSQGSAKPEEIKRFSLRAGDVIITKDSETPEDIAVPAIVEANAAGVVCGYHLAMLRPIASEVHGSYLFWSLKAKPIREAFTIEAKGVTRYGLTLGGIGSVAIPTPELNIQRAVANFLDRETARIDQLIEKKERQIKLLDQRARQIVSDLVIGMIGATPSVETGLDFIPRIPAHWLLRRAGVLFQQVAEPNLDDLPVLSVSIHRGISDRQLDDEERDRKVNLIADRSSYKRVRPGYLAYNMMRAWQGAVGVSTVDGAVSPAYVVAKPKRDIHSLYYQFLLRTPPFIEQMRQGSKGITDFRLRLYWEQFRQIMLPVPPLEEQQQIATKAEQALSYAAKLAGVVAASVERLKERRAALITAAVAGQIDVRQRPTAIAAKADRSRFRVIVGAEIVQNHQGNAKFGRVKLQKELYLAEAHVGITELQGTYLREAAGPLDRTLVEETESGMEAASLFRAALPDIHAKNVSVTYTPLPKAGQHRAELDTLLGPRAAALRELIKQLSDFDTRAVEAIATLYAVWNDALIDGEISDDDAVVRAVLNDWHPEKREKFKDADLRHWLEWMKRNRLVPSGNGPRTISTTSRDMFA